MGSEIATINQGTLSVSDMKQQVQLIQHLMREIMGEGEHYGKIPGMGEKAKPTLLKPGAEKLCFVFRLDPQFETTEHQEGDHLTVKSKCILYHIPSGARVGSGEGSCSTREKKYAYRDAQRKCPSCGQEAIIKGKEEYGGGWLCFNKKGGCGAKFEDADERITAQQTGQVPNPDLPDLWNTVLKMANKRAMVAAVLVSTAASDIFTQDLEDLEGARKSANPPIASTPQKTMPIKEKTPDEIVGRLPQYLKKLMYSVGIDTPEKAYEVFRACNGDHDAIKQWVNEQLKKGHSEPAVS